MQQWWVCRKVDGQVRYNYVAVREHHDINSHRHVTKKSDSAHNWEDSGENSL